jgi:hypothetical protein
MKRRTPEVRSSPRKRGPRAGDCGAWIPASAGMSGIERRAFISVLVTAAAWPRAARTQQRGRVRRIGVLVGASENDPEAPTSAEAFRQTLDQLGWKWTAFCAARSQATCRCRRRPSLSWSSILKQQRRLASTCRPCCLPAPTR